MTTRSIETTVTFAHPFTLSALGAVQPPGTYKLVVDEDEIPGISFLAYQRVAKFLHSPALFKTGKHCVFTIDPDKLCAALEADRVPRYP